MPFLWWRSAMQRTMPFTWAMMYQAARMRHRMVFGHWGHDPFVRAVYYGRGR